MATTAKTSPLTVSVRLTESEMALLRTYASLAECNITDVCRNCIRKLLPELEELVAELEKRNRVISYASRFLPVETDDEAEDKTIATDNSFAPQLDSDAEDLTLPLPLSNDTVVIPDTAPAPPMPALA